MQVRIAPSLGALERHPNEAWGTTDYVSEKEPVVFMGMYSLSDLKAFMEHEGEKYVFWCGSDIRHFINGYWLDDDGVIKVPPQAIAPYLNKYEHWVENDVEAKALNNVGIDTKVCPSFMGDINKYRLEYKPTSYPQVYASVSGDDFKLYGWDKIEELAAQYPRVEFHLYGNKQTWETHNKNVVVHGRVPKDVMNREVKKMTGGIRPVAFDGFSEVLAKSVLWGQWPIATIKYPYMLGLSDLDKLENRPPNKEGRAYYRKILNNYPWRKK